MKFLVNVFVLLLLLTCEGILAQCSLYEIPLNNRINSASLIIEGKVVGKRSFRDNENNKIYTLNEIEIFKIFKGSTSLTNINVVTEGGTVGDEMVVTSNLLSLKKGDIGVFILQSIKPFRMSKYFSNKDFEVVASMQGFIKYDPVTLIASDVFNEYTNINQQLYPLLSQGRKFKTIISFDVSELINDQLKNSGVIPLISGFEPMEITAGTNELLIINGSGFGNTRGDGSVGFRNADDGGASFVTPLPTQYVKWEDNQIIVEVPDNAGTGTIKVTKGISVLSQATLKVIFSRLNLIEDEKAFSATMISKSLSGGYVWQMTELFDLNKAAGASFKRAFDTWKCNTGVNWLIGDMTSVNVTKRDEINIIRFDSSEELPEGVLGVAYSYYSSCQAGKWYLSEIDLVFDAAVNWQYDTDLPGPSQVDMETIALHELGHAHQLGHVIDPSDIMHYSYSTGTQNRELNESNIAAGILVMLESTRVEVCGFNPMEKIPSVICGISELDQLSFDGLIISPNPTTTSFKLVYTLAEKSSVNIDVFDNLGQKVHILVNETQPIGIYEYHINMNELNIASGIYFVRLYLNGVKSTYKVIRI